MATLTLQEQYSNINPLNPTLITAPFTLICTDPDIPVLIGDPAHAIVCNTASDIEIRNSSGVILTKDADDGFFLIQQVSDIDYSKKYSPAAVFSRVKFASAGTYTLTKFLDAGTYPRAYFFNAVCTFIKTFNTETWVWIQDQFTTLSNAVSDLASQFASHSANSEIHISQSERNSWNAKITPYVVATNAEMLALTDMIIGSRCYVDDDGSGSYAFYMYNGTVWKLEATPDWANVNIDWSTVTNKPSAITKITESGGLPLWDGGAWPGGSGSGSGDVISDVSASVAGNIAAMSGTDGKHITDIGASADDLMYGFPVQFASGLTLPQGICGIGTDLYVSEQGGSVKKISSAGAVTSFATGLSQPKKMVSIGTDIYVVETTAGNIKKITASGTVSTFKSGLTQPYAITAIGTDLYVASPNTVTKYASDGTPTLIKDGLATNIFGITTDGEFLYIAEYTGAIKKISLSGVVTTIKSGLSSPYNIVILNGYLYVSCRGDYDTTLYRISMSGATRVHTAGTHPNMYGMTVLGGVIYYNEYNSGTVVKVKYSQITQSSILNVNMSGGNVSLLDSRIRKIRLFGAMSANTTLTILSNIESFEIINDTTGTGYQYIKTANGSGIYSAPGDIWDVYCDGTNIVPIALLSSTREIVLPLITFSMGATSAQVPLSSVTPTSDALSEIGSNVFTAKNRGKYQIRGYAAPSAALTSVYLIIYKNGTALYTGSRDSVNTASYEVRSSISSVVQLNAGDTLSVYIGANAADASMRAQQLCITQIS